MSSRPKISVVIATFNRPYELGRLLVSLEQQTFPANQIIIVDASHESVSTISLNPDKHILIKANRGLATQRNKGIREAKGDIILFVDDDAILTPKCLEVIVREFTGHDSNKIGALTGQIIDGKSYKPKHWNLARIFLLGEGKGSGKFKLSGFPSLASGERDKEVEVLCGGVMAFRTVVLNKIGGFNELLEKTGPYAYMEDQDIALRVKEAGMKIKYLSEVKIYHFPSPRGRGSSYEVECGKVINSRYILEKRFGKRFINKLAWWWAMVGMVVLKIRVLDFKGVVGVLKGISIVLTRGI